MYICLTFTIYAIIRSNWYSGYGILIFCLTEMYILCILGTAISTEVTYNHEKNCFPFHFCSMQNFIWKIVLRYISWARRILLKFNELDFILSSLSFETCPDLLRCNRRTISRSKNNILQVLQIFLPTSISCVSLNYSFMHKMICDSYSKNFRKI